MEEPNGPQEALGSLSIFNQESSFPMSIRMQLTFMSRRHSQALDEGQHRPRPLRPYMAPLISEGLHGATKPGIGSVIWGQHSIRSSGRLSVYPSIHPLLFISSGQMVGHQWRKQDISNPKKNYPIFFTRHIPGHRLIHSSSISREGPGSFPDIPGSLGSAPFRFMNT